MFIVILFTRSLA